ncbi:hypothetical protein MMRN_32550 [Mycobacterium marinum]|nr:hypothetical protein MMRN_32550 [Mycobacterium marinum]
MHSNGCSDRESVVATLDRLDRAVDALVEVSFEALTTPERLRVLERLEVVARRLPVAQYALLNQLDEQAGEAELGGRLAAVVASRLRITRSEAGRRVAEAADVGPRRVERSAGGAGVDGHGRGFAAGVVGRARPGDS